MKEKTINAQKLEAVRWLFKPLDLEQRTRCRDTAVSGGIEKWIPRVREKLVAQAKLGPEEVGRLLDCLEGYGPAEPESRTKKIVALFDALDSLARPPERASPSSSLPKVSRPQAETREHRLDLREPVQYVKGVGPQRARLLKKLGINVAGDLLRYFPRDWQDRRNLTRIQDCRAGEVTTISGRVKARQTFTIRRGLNLTKVILDDGTGQIAGTWFNQPYLRERFPVGELVLLHGKVDFKRTWQIMNPEFEILEEEGEEKIHTGRIVPVYPLTERLSQRVLRGILYSVVRCVSDQAPDILPQAVSQSRGFPPAHQALRDIHFPPDFESLERARQRLVFEELFLQQIAVSRLKQRYQRQVSRPLCTDGPLVRRFSAELPFTLTSAQEQAVRKIFQDLSTARPMHRLLQGDVGSGKTIVAALAMLAAVDSGKQAAIMAPTEVLAVQHYLNLKKLLDPYGVRLELFTSGIKGRDRAAAQAALADGRVQVAVGTHALTQEQLNFRDLGLAVVDEQHRFGVQQRARLRAKGDQPHLLVMTATPIPRTLAMTVYGDLDVTTLDEMPPGRLPVQTEWLPRANSRRAYEALSRVLDAGQQGYIVFPLIEESEKLDLKALTTEYERLSKHIFPGRKMGLLHGRLTTAEKEQVMTDFKERRLEILAATSVIEVGVDISNASVMIIENADRFGLASLHQLRGRVGRGTAAAVCFLIADPTTEEGRARLKIVSQVRDGFRLAEEDLALRGPGEFFGLRQHGLPDLKLANLIRDADQIEKARDIAMNLIASDPKLRKPEHAQLARVYHRVYEEREQRALAG